MNCFLIFWWMGIFGRLGLARVSPMALNTVQRSRQSPRTAPSMEASSFLSSWLSSVSQLVRSGVASVPAFCFWRRLEALFGYRAAFWPDVEIATFLSLLRSWIFCFCSHGGRRSAAGLTAVAATRCELSCDSDAAATQSEPLHGSVAAFFGLEGAGSGEFAWAGSGGFSSGCSVKYCSA
jgi:hypothetical protein